MFFSKFATKFANRNILNSKNLLLSTILLLCAAAPNAYGTTFWANNAQHATTSCSGDDVTVPSTNPTPLSGYVFSGWAPAYVLGNLNRNINGDVYYAKTDTGTCYYRTADMSSSSSESCSGANYSDLARGEWKTVFSYGTVRGISLCSTTVGSAYAANGNPVETTGANCWCRATGFNDGTTDFIPAVSLWAFRGTSGSDSDCASNCSILCGYRVQCASSFRAGVFGSVASN